MIIYQLIALGRCFIHPYAVMSSPASEPSAFATPCLLSYCVRVHIYVYVIY